MSTDTREQMDMMESDMSLGSVLPCWLLLRLVQRREPLHRYVPVPQLGHAHLFVWSLIGQDGVSTMQMVSIYLILDSGAAFSATSDSPLTATSTAVCIASQARYMATYVVSQPTSRLFRRRSIALRHLHIGTHDLSPHHRSPRLHCHRQRLRLQ